MNKPFSGLRWIRASSVLVMVVALFLTSSMAFAAIPTQAGKPLPLSADEKLLKDTLDLDYAMDLLWRLSSFDYPFVGEVIPGSIEDYETSNYIAGEMRSIGLDDVTMESFKLVNWEPASASLEIMAPEHKVIPTRSHGMGWSTPDGGPIEAEIVDVGYGRTQDYEAVPGGVEGKIVLIERNEVMWYMGPSVREAVYQGALAAVVWNPDRDPSGINMDCAHNNATTLSITVDDAMYIKGLLSEGPVHVKLSAESRFTEGSDAYIVYGFIWGNEFPDEYVLLEAHTDHWWSGANDNNAAIASQMAIAKAIVDSGIQPKRTIVFMSCSGHESGMGGSQESFWDWALGTHFFMTQLHPEWADRIVMSFVSDYVGIPAAVMYVETTPEMGGFLTKLFRDTGISSLMLPFIFTPVSSFDSWSFYAAGVPTCSIYNIDLTGLHGEFFYHMDISTVDRVIDSEYLMADMVYRAVGALRMSENSILPYELTEISDNVREALGLLVAAVPDADVSSLLSQMDSFDEAALALDEYVDGLKRPTKAQIVAINAQMHLAAKTVNPHIWDQDIGIENPLPGWCTVSKFDTYTNDMAQLMDAIGALEAGDGNAALYALENVATMNWGEHVSYPVYLDCLWIFNGTNYLNWAEGFLPWITNVHQVHSSVEEKACSPGADYSWEISQLESKLDLLYSKLAGTTLEVEQAFAQGTPVLQTP